MKNVPIRVKVLLALAVCVAIALAAIVVVMRQAYSDDISMSGHQSIATSARAFQNVEARDTAMLSAAVDSLSTREDLATAFQLRDRAKVEALSAPLFANLKQRYGITHMYFIQPDGKVFLRAHKPAQFGDELKRSTFLKARDTNDHGAGLELGATAFALRVVRPWYVGADGVTQVASKGKLIGYLELGEEIDHFLGILKDQTGSEFGLLLQKDKMDAKAWGSYRAQKNLKDNWGDQKQYVLAGSTKADFSDEMVYTKPAAGIAESGDLLGTFDEEGGKTEIRGVFPVVDANGKKVGAVFTERDITETADTLKASENKVMIVVIVLAIALAIVLGLLLETLVFRRLAKMMEHMENASLHLAGGDYEIQASPTGGNDEIGKFERFYGDFVKLIAGALKQAGRKAG